MLGRALDFVGDVHMKIAIFALAASAAVAAGPQDADTRAWWHLTGELSGDAMEGRDTGSPGYDRAASLVARRLAAAGLRPVGDNGGWYQRLPLDELRITSALISVGSQRLRFLNDITAAPSSVPTTLDLPIVYRGYCSPDVLGDVRGKLVICHGTHRVGLPGAAQRMEALVAAG